MSDWATVRQAVIEGWKLDESGDADDLVNRSICQALVAVRPLALSFNTSTFSLDTIADQASYAKHVKGASSTNKLPWDFRGVVGGKVRLDRGKGGDANTYRDLVEVDPSEFDELAWDTANSTWPSAYTVWNEKLWINPPSDQVDELYARYLQDLETPVPKYTSGGSPEWTYIGADGNAINADTFTNDWFTRGFDLLISRAAMQYFGRFERNKKNADAAKEAYATALTEIKRDYAPLFTQGRIQPFLGVSRNTNRTSRNYWPWRSF